MLNKYLCDIIFVIIIYIIIILDKLLYYQNKKIENII